MKYHDLDLWIESSSDGEYIVRARSMRGGEDKDASSLRLDDLRQDLERLSQGDTDSAYLVDLGARLYQALFQTKDRKIEAHFDRCCGADLGTAGEGLRLWLHLEDPEVAALPWEYLYWKRQARFLGTWIHTPLIRYLELPLAIKALRTAPPFRMLVVIPAYTGAAKLAASTEKKHLLEAIQDLKDKGELEATVLEGQVTRSRISDALLEQPYHLFHFIGHGDFRDERAYLVLNDAHGAYDHVDHEDFASRFFLNHPTMKLVVLNACKGAAVSSSKSLVGMAPHLVRQGVPAVVAMQYPIYDREALCFAREFYRSLFRGWAAGRVEVALSHARNVLADDFPDRRAVGTPVLFMHAREGVLFDVVTGKRWQDTPYDPRAVETMKAVMRTYDRNIEVSDDPEFVAGQQAAREEVGRRIRFRNVSLATATAVALLMFFGLWMGLFDWLPKFLKPEQLTVWFGDMAATKTLDEAVALVTIDAETERRLGRPLDGSWRAEHARLIDHLGQAGARVIAFDMDFSASRPELDTTLARAMRRADSSGTAVVVGVVARGAEGRPALAEPLQQAVGGWGVPCLGLPGHGPNVIPLLAVTADGAARLPSLALQAFAASLGAVRTDLDPLGKQVNLFDEAGRSVGRIPVAGVATSGPQAACDIIGPGDSVAEMIIDLTPLRPLKARRFPYQDVVDATRPAALAAFAGKVVLVGLERPSLERWVWRGLNVERRHGVYLQADAVNTLLRGVSIRWLSGWGQFALMLVMAMLGALAAYAPPEEARATRLGALAAALAAYLGGALYLYLGPQLLLNALYHVLALFVSYATVRKIKRRFFP